MHFCCFSLVSLKNCNSTLLFLKNSKTSSKNVVVFLVYQTTVDTAITLVELLEQLGSYERERTPAYAAPPRYYTPTAASTPERRTVVQCCCMQYYVVKRPKQKSPRAEGSLVNGQSRQRYATVFCLADRRSISFGQYVFMESRQINIISYFLFPIVYVFFSF